MNEYYTPPSDITALSRIRSSKINEIIDSIDAGFDNVPADLQDYVDEIIAARKAEADLEAEIDSLQGQIDALEAIVVSEIGLPPLESGKFLTNNGSVISWGYTGSQLISTATASSSATVEFTGLGSAFSGYVVVGYGVAPVTDNQPFCVRVQSGGSWQTGATDYAYANYKSPSNSTVSQSNSVGEAYIKLGTDGVGNGSEETIDFQVSISGVASTTKKKIIETSCGYFDDSSIFWSEKGHGIWKDVPAITGLQFFFASGDIASGTFNLYGVK